MVDNRVLKGPRKIVQPDIRLQVRPVPIEKGMVDRAYRRVVGKPVRINPRLGSRNKYTGQ